MADRKDVISHLQIIHTWASFDAGKPGQMCTFLNQAEAETVAEWTKQALDLLEDDATQIQYLNDSADVLKADMKSLEPMEPIEDGCLFRCPKCRMSIFVLQKYCGSCGQAVKWDG